MKRFITNDDLTVLVTKALTLRKLAKSAQKIHTDLAVEQRAKIEEQLERDQQFLECAQLEYGKKNPAFSAVVAEIEAVLRDLAAIYVAAKH
jgi:hypothetical protein